VTATTNLFAGLSVFTLASGTEDTTAQGSVALSSLLAAQEPDAGTSNLLGVPIAIDFKLGTEVAYVAAQAADMVQRVQYNGTRAPIVLGTNAQFSQLDLRGAGTTKVPNGIVVAHGPATAYTHNWIDRSVSILNLGNLSVDTVVTLEPQPTGGALGVQNGKKFYFTGTGRWATRGVNSCGSCHPDGLSDNITWIFAAGPRQTTPMDGTFSKLNGNDQRALNWTAIFDEVHDVELNTRGTAGGVGAIVTATAPVNGSRFDLAAPVRFDGGVLNPTRNDFLSGSTKQATAFRSVLKDWDEINEFSKTIQANKAPTTLNATMVAAGRTHFIAGECASCHGGDKWTISRTPYEPNQDKTGMPAQPADGVVAPNGYRTEVRDGGNPALPNGNVLTDTNKVAIEATLAADGGAINVGPERITCVLREVGTFDVQDPLERKADGSQAQGRKGFNPPSLLGMATSAPYFHHGRAATLDDLLANAAFVNHLQAGNALFTPTTTQRAELVEFLKSIDDSTAKVAVPANQDVCGGY
jgi:hypothetical protein